MNLLETRTKEFDIPPTPYLPVGANVIVFRVPNVTKSAGGLYLPDTAQEPEPMGVLIAAGLTARDVMREALVELGDIVWFAKYAGWEKEIKRDPANKGKDVVQMKVSDLLGSVDALKRAEGYAVVRDDDKASPSYGEHFYEEVQ